jgi:5-methylcytosine-specific restriction endonuclease McrA
MARKDNQKWHRKRHRIGDACAWRCFYCDGIIICPNCYPDTPREYMATFDHFYPKSKGGGNTYGNLVLACGPCNQDKDDKVLTKPLTHTIGALT